MANFDLVKTDDGGLGIGFKWAYCTVRYRMGLNDVVGTSRPYRTPRPVLHPTPRHLAIQRRQRTVAKRNRGLIQRARSVGGLPSRPIETEPPLWDPSRDNAELHEINHWSTESRKFGYELELWKKFNDSGDQN